MEFFDRKEEVIDIQLTQYGKHLLSRGKFRPVFYAFYDDDIIYDAKYANDNEENQKLIEDRIKNTPRIKSQYSFSGRELKANKIDTGTCKGQMSSCDKLQVSKEKHYALGLPLGTSEVNSHKHPAWSVKFLRGGLSGSSYYSESTKEEVEFTFFSDTSEHYVNSYENRDKYIDLSSTSADGTGKTYRYYSTIAGSVSSPPKPPNGMKCAVSLEGLSTKESFADKFKFILNAAGFYQGEDKNKVFSVKVESSKVTVINKKYGPSQDATISGLTSVKTSVDPDPQVLTTVITMEQKVQGKIGAPKYLPIPQLDIKLKTKVGIVSDYGESPATELPTSFGYDTPTYLDGTRLYYSSEQLVLEIIENNAPLLMENVDIEVFKVGEDENGIEELIPLMFQKPIDFIVDNLLLDGREIANAYRANVMEEGPHMVNYFLDLAVDREIDMDISKIDKNIEEAIKSNIYLGRDRNEEDPCDDEDAGNNTDGAY